MFKIQILADAAAGGLHITSTMLLLGALALVASYFGISALRSKRIEVEARVIDFKRDCQSAAGFFQKIGLPHSAAFWNALALEDIPTAKKEVHTILAIFKSDSQRTAALIEVVDEYIAEIKKDGDDDEVARLQKVLGGTAADAANAALPTGAQLAALVKSFNPTPPGATTQIVHHLPPVVFQPPALATSISHGLADAATMAAAAAAPAGAPVAAAILAGAIGPK